MEKVGVVQYSMDMQVLGAFDSIREAQRAYGITHVSSVCQRKRVTDGGFVWRYDDDVAPNEFSREGWMKAGGQYQRKHRRKSAVLPRARRKRKKVVVVEGEGAKKGKEGEG